MALVVDLVSIACFANEKAAGKKLSKLAGLVKV
jgi:hypothetical protein